MTFKYAGVALLGVLAAAGPAGAAKAQDVAAGETIFRQKCRVCHQIGEGAKNFVGPNLDGLIGRKTGTVENYAYSEANKNSGLVWDESTFKDYITDPKAKIPGTKMIFAGLPKAADRDNLFAYLSQFDAAGHVRK